MNTKVIKRGRQNPDRNERHATVFDETRTSGGISKQYNGGWRQTFVSLPELSVGVFQQPAVNSRAIPVATLFEIRLESTIDLWPCKLFIWSNVEH